MIDIHSHILPSVDDGAQNISESIKIVKLALEQGVRGIVATPHVMEYPSASFRQRVQSAFDELQQECLARELAISLYLGAECRISPDLADIIRANPQLTLNGGSRYVLLELPFYDIPIFTKQVIYDLQLMGITPIIAHPERCEPIAKDLSILEDFVDGGLFTQIDASSILGRFGGKIARTAKKIMLHGMGHIVASDVHSPQKSSYDLAAARRSVLKFTAADRAEKMFVELPHRVVHGRQIAPIARCSGGTEKKRWYHLW